jgi:plastocyanin domain-containing protein
MKRTIFLITAAGSTLTAFLFFQPVSGDGGGLMMPVTSASPVASTSEQPVAFASPTASKVFTGNVSTTTPTLKAKSSITSSTVINSPSIQGGLSIKGGGGDDDDDDEGYDDDEDDDRDDDEGDDD